MVVRARLAPGVEGRKPVRRSLRTCLRLQFRRSILVLVAGLDALTLGRFPGMAPSSQLQGMNGPAPLVQQVSERPDRVTPGHARPGVSHDAACGLALRGLVAVDRALGAGRFGDAVRALFEPSFSVLHEVRALVAKAPLAPAVMSVAVNVRHATKGLVFVQQLSFELAHEYRIKVLEIHQFDRRQARRRSADLLSLAPR